MKLFLLTFCLYTIQSAQATTSPPGYGENSGKLCGVNQCKNGEKCIDTVRQHCEVSTCTKFPTCVILQARECVSDSCSHNQVCLNVQQDCGPGRPCNIVKKCVPRTSSAPSLPIREESCGVNRCGVKEKCIETVKEHCNDASCTKYPTCVRETAQECYTQFCPLDKVCVHVQEECHQQPCRVTRKCVSGYAAPIVVPVDTCGTYKCHEGLKCIETVRPSCRDKSCTRYPTCVPVQAQACTTSACRRNELCVNVQEDCTQKSCPIEKKCISSSVSDHLERCGVHTCRAGEHCYEVVKSDCQSADCPKYPVCLKQQELPCNFVDCKPNTVCENVYTACPYTACDIYARCVPKEHVSFPPSPIRRNQVCGATKCDKGLKCIETVKLQCEDSSCTRYPTCVPLVARPCTEHECGNQQVCVNVQEDCPGQACPVNKRCVPIAGSGVQCQNKYCNTDEICVDTLECDDRGCQNTQACLPKNAATCDTALCRRHTECFMVKPAYCQGDACYPVPQCIFTGDGETTCGSLTCHSSEKCAKVFDCPGAGCPSWHRCLPEDVSTCRDLRCKECRMIQHRCVAPPCYPSPVCFDDEINDSNRCGLQTCRPDEECTQVYDCIEPGCGPSYTCLSKAVRTCRDVSCRNCRMVQLKRCFAPPCDPEPYCEQIDNNRRCGRQTCQSGDECAEVFDCIHPGCSSSYQCLPSSVRTCSDSVCTGCKMVQLKRCVTSPCYPEPHCLDQGSTTCQRRACGRHETCIKALECSGQRGCVETDACIPRGASTCANVKCNRLTECAMITDPLCHKSNCHPVPQCIPSGRQKEKLRLKEGLCPRLPHNPPGPPCKDDYNCSATDKCCLLEGASQMTCTTPVQGGDKPGRCPEPNLNLPSSCDAGYESSVCTQDRDCALDYKCCANGCTKVCRVPVLFDGN